LEKTVEQRTHEVNQKADKIRLQADQLASSNKELEQKNQEIIKTQEQLIIQEKLASLGSLTAGIAHEIKNPLNFVNNFSALSIDLTKELRNEIKQQKDKLDLKNAQVVEEILNDLEQNVQKINEHGKRADSIVKGMLSHSSGKAGEKELTDINALLAEHVNLAYHGLRAADRSFNVKIESSYDQTIGLVNVFPQNLSRAFINIVNNGCYAANEKRKVQGDTFSPTLQVSTKNLGEKVEIRIRDNGIGIPKNILEKIFNPFFTTKPTGMGTGLGLSLTFDIIVREHNGDIKVDTKEGEFAEFIIALPKG
jgi:signal transduction histidine kinase